MRLTDLNPRWVNAGGEGVFNADGSPAKFRRGVGLMLSCPCRKCDPEYDWVYVGLANPLDGGPCLEPSRPKWTREGEAFETLTLTPSILRLSSSSGCKWHGWIKNGEVISCD